MSKIITVFGSKGKSTVATNLAVALTKKDFVVGIIGANTTYGSLQTYFSMKIEPEKSIKRAINTTIEDDRIKTFSQHPKLKNLFILSLANSESVLSINKVTEEEGKKLILNTKDKFDFLIIDATASCKDDTLTFLGLYYADNILNVIFPNLQGSSYQLSHMEFFNKLNLTKKLINVLNCYDNSMSIKEIEEITKSKFDIVLPFSNEVEISTNVGLPLVLSGASDKRSDKYLKGINGLVDIIEGIEEKTIPRKSIFKILKNKGGQST